ncbi:MAG: hypothetical protein WBP38_07290 [Hyphomicrobium sp.]|nr:hypothetical protein [Hyphomicrobium sp.]
MTALTKDRNTAERDGEYVAYAVGADKKLHAGSLVVLDAGLAEPGNTAAGLIAVGRAEEHVDNTGGAAGAKTVKVKRGVFCFENAAADPVLAAHIGASCFVVDDQTVAATHGGNTRSVAGFVVDVDDAGVWVKF